MDARGRRPDNKLRRRDSLGACPFERPQVYFSGRLVVVFRAKCTFEGVGVRGYSVEFFAGGQRLVQSQRVSSGRQ